MALRLLGWIARLALAGIFIAAGFIKLREPFLFEMGVDSYQLLPPWGVILVARTLPWLEVALGLLLLIGWKLRYVASFTAVLLTGFIGAMAITYSRGIEANCGCFGAGEKISPLTLARDSSFLVLAVFLAVYSWIQYRKSKASALPAPPEGQTA